MRRHLVSIAAVTALIGASCSDDPATSPDGTTPPTVADPALTLTVPDPPYGIELTGLADSRAWASADYPPGGFNDYADIDAGAVLVATTQPDVVDFPRRVLVCAQPAENGPALVDRIAGDTIDLGHATAKVSDTHDYALPTCGAPDRTSLIWHDNGWLVNATAMDGNVDNAEYVAAAVRISTDGVFTEPALDRPWVVSGRLDAGWTAPTDHAVNLFARSDDDDPDRNLQFTARIVTVTASERHAIAARLSEDPDEIVGRTSSVPAYNLDDYGEPRLIDAEGTRVMLGAWGPSTIAAVVMPTDETASGVALLAGGFGGFPTPRELAGVTARVRGVDTDERAALIDALPTPSLYPVDARFRPTDEAVPIFLTHDGNTFRAVPYIQRHELWDVATNTSTFVERLHLETNRQYAPHCGIFRNSDRTQQLNGAPVTVRSVDVPLCSDSTFKEPTHVLPSRPSDQIEIIVLAEPGVEVEVEVDGAARPLPLFEITTVATTPGAVVDTGPWTGGERWGRTIVTAPNGRDSIVIRASRDGEVIHEQTANPFG